jgi:RNA polymerase sigma factor (sigma-70 family)
LIDPGCGSAPFGHFAHVSHIAPDQRAAEFEALFHATYARVLSYACAMANPDDADDAVSEAYAIAWRRLDDVPEGAELGWLIGVTRRVLANARRGRRRADALRALIRLQPRVDSLDPADRSSDARVGKALRSLRPLDREALVLVAWFDLDPAQAAVALGIEPAAFRMRLTRARRRLRTALDAADERLAAAAITTKEAPRCHPS